MLKLSKQDLPPDQARHIDALCDRFEKRWQAGLRPHIEEYLGETQRLARSVLLDELLKVEIAYRRRHGEQPRLEEYLQRFPGHFAGLELFPEEEPAREEATVVGGQVVPGYEVLRTLPAGGMGVVYQARDVALNRVVALKVVPPGGEADTQWLERFRAEARAVAALDHPNVVRIYQYGEHKGRPYFVMEFVEGGSLAEKLRSGPLPAHTAARLLEPVARAVHYVHGRQLIHRDLKPANILLAVDGTPKVADFGLAKRLDTDQGLTASQALLGTAAYMSPEQAAGRARAVGPAADVWALGAVLYETLTGRPPFRGETWLETLDQVRFEEVVPPSRLRPDVARETEVICLRCLEKRAAERYPSAECLADDLRSLLGRGN
jgi:serine/threonine protein kinase